MNSEYYYAADAELRGVKAKEVLDKQKKDGVCGCFSLEFDNCINTKYKNNCTIKLLHYVAMFYEPKEPNCIISTTLSNAENYLVIGITKELALTLAILEKLSLLSFSGQNKVRLVVDSHGICLFNPLTNITLNRAISTRNCK